MKKIIAISFLFCLVSNISWGQQKKLQLSVNTNLIDAHAAVEFKLSKNSTLYTGIGFGYGNVFSFHLNEYFDNNAQKDRNSDVLLPEIYFAPYINVQYRNYFLRARDIRKGYYTGNNSGIYAGARLKAYTAPIISINEDVKEIRQNYLFGLMIGGQKAVGAQRRIVLNGNMGISTHANYNLSFFGFKPMLYGSVGYIIK